MKRERQTEREKILLEIISNSTLVLTKIMKKKKREKSRVMMWVKDQLKQSDEEEAHNNIIRDCYRFYQEKLD